MKVLTQHIIGLLSILLVGCYSTEKQSVIKYSPVSIIAPSQSTVGQSLILTAISNGNVPELLLSHGLGVTVVQPTLIDSTTSQYIIPSALTQMSGVMQWNVLNGKKEESGIIFIKPESEVADIEVYIGPTTLQAGRPKTAMTTAMVYDQYDNLIPSHPTILNTTSTNGDIKKDKSITDYGLVYHYHNAPTKTGNLTVALNTGSNTTSEYTYRVNANQPTRFNMEENRQHGYADGTSICIIESNILKDRYGNVVEDGTIVNFTITNNNVISQAQGMTIDGKATAQFLHPDSPCTWQVIGRTGNAESKPLTIAFAAAINNLPSSISPEYLLTIGPIQSYMSQLIPDGYPLTIEIKNSNSTLINRRIYTLDGIATLDLNTLNIIQTSEPLTLTISGGGITHILDLKTPAQSIPEL